MAKDKYMALADFQHLWSEKIKPAIQNSMMPMTHTDAVRDSSGNTLTSLLGNKQDVLTAGTGIAIENNVIRATSPDMRELLVLTLAPTHVVEGTDPLLNTTFTITSAGATIASGTWEGTAIQIRIDTTQQYTISFGSASDYLSPEPMTFNPILLNTRVVTASYTYDPSDELVIDESVENPATRIISGANGQNVQAIAAGTHRYLGKIVDDGNGGDKMLLCQLSDTDSTKFFDGETEAPLDGTQGDVWVKHPDTWIKAERDGDRVTLKIKTTDNGGRKFPTECLIGAYEASSTTTKYGTEAETTNNGTVGYLRSISGVASLGKVSKTNFSLKAARKGTGFSLVKPHHQNLFAVLGYAKYGTCNLQAQCGSGTNSSKKNTGQTNSLGMTDTTSQNGNSMSINFFGLENWWGNKYEWMDANIINGGVWTITEDDGTTRSITAPTVSRVTYAMRFIWGDYIDVVPEATQTGGSNSKGYCDGYNGSTAGSRVAQRSGNVSYPVGGVAYVDASSDASYTYAGSGSRLAFKGTCEITTDVTSYLAAEPKA